MQTMRLSVEQRPSRVPLAVMPELDGTSVDMRMRIFTDCDTAFLAVICDHTLFRDQLNLYPEFSAQDEAAFDLGAGHPHVSPGSSLPIGRAHTQAEPSVNA